MEFNLENVMGYFKSIKLPKIRLPKLNLREIEIGKPPRWLVIMIAIIIQIVLIFFILWLFDDRTVFDGDYMVKTYRGQELQWGWFRRGVTIITIIGAVALFISIFTEFAAYDKNGRAFYNLYDDDNYRY